MNISIIGRQQALTDKVYMHNIHDIGYLNVRQASAVLLGEKPNFSRTTKTFGVVCGGEEEDDAFLEV